MENKNLVKFLPQILIAIGAVIGIIAFFVDWYATGNFSITGQKMIDYNSGGWQMFIPLIILILGIVTLIVSALPHFVDLSTKAANIMVIVLGIIMITLFIVLFIKDFEGGKFGDHAAIGTWLGLAAGFVPVVVGVIGYFDVFDKLYYIEKK